MKRALLPRSSTGTLSSTGNHKLDNASEKERLLKLLQQHFGHSNFRGRQLEAIETVLSGKDCFCLMPTGGGQSLCYQIPSVAREGVVLVVSPLIALMENQVCFLKSRGIPAEYLSSTQKAATKEKIYEDIDSGKPTLRMLYVTPELISTNGFMTKLKKLHSRGLLHLIAIDEAHCISSWGHDFRSSYRRLSTLRNFLPGVPMLALTATAARKVQEDVIKSLCLHKPLILRTSFNRPNIYYEVRYKDLLRDAYTDLLEMLKKTHQECAIIYCLARNTCNDIAARLLSDGISCCVYHAGLNDKVRSQALEDWASGKVPVVVATVAFGMGIDRKDVRTVCHFNIPKSMESFYQESGRAGRDQKPSRSILYYGLDDRRSMEFILNNSSQKKGKKDKSQDAICKKSVSDFEKMVDYCEGSGCRRQKVLAHFGEQVSTSLCSKTCDSCKHPNRISKELDELSSTSCFRGKNQFSSFVSASNLNATRRGYKNVESEFWNESDETSDHEEDISSSDDEASKSAAACVRGQSIVNAHLDKRLDCLLRAEEEYDSKQGFQRERKELNNKTVPENLRDAARQRLKITVEQALNRLGDENLDLQSVTILLENECYMKYGKLGRSFYNSQVASTVRWLASSSMKDIRSRIEPLSTLDASKSKSPLMLNKIDSLIQRSCSLIEPKTCDMEKKDVLKQADDKQKSVVCNRMSPDNGASGLADNSAAQKHLPPISSFKSFASNRGKNNDCKMYNEGKRPLTGEVEDRDSTLKKRKLTSLSSFNCNE